MTTSAIIAGRTVGTRVWTWTMEDPGGVGVRMLIMTDSVASDTSCVTSGDMRTEVDSHW